MDKNDAPLMPVLQLRNSVAFPSMVVPLVLRHKSLDALEVSVSSNKQLFLLAQKDPETEIPKPDEFYNVGTIVNVLQVLKLPDNTIKILVEGVKRGTVEQLKLVNGIFWGHVKPLKDFSHGSEEENSVLMRMVTEAFAKCAKINSRLPVELLDTLAEKTKDPGMAADLIAAQLLYLPFAKRQEILETVDITERLVAILKLLSDEIELSRMEEELKDRVKNQVLQTQQEYFLREKMKAVQKELEDLTHQSHPISEIEQFRQRIEKAKLPHEAHEQALSELSKLEQMQPVSPEYTIVRNYLNCLLNLPWNAKSKENHSLKFAEKVLNEDHYGLEKVKERILEYLAVRQRVKKGKGPIICFVGAPGVGKTSLGHSIARATGRTFVRMSLGGVRDEAEIRGHRRTYIGSEPGKILQKLTRAKVKNPLFLLDEIDKMSLDYHGDPASALLEVLDPEQNSTFNDHYLELDFDLSDVMFVATANSQNIPPALLDRMEIINLSGYTEEEKLNIATKYLIPKQMAANGVKNKELVFTDEALRTIIRSYTMEAGVRNLERQIAKICRKVVKTLVTDDDSKTAKKTATSQFTITPDVLVTYLGAPQIFYGVAEKENAIGEVNGLAWTEAGGDLLTIEVAAVPGKGKVLYTGNLGEVMQESIQAALTVVRSRNKALGIKDNFYEKNDLHVHVPEGATPKDGPSAGITMCTAIVSALTKIPVRADLAMTGEITLRGDLLPIGGLKEKLLAALRAGIKEVIIPDKNRKDLRELPPTVLKNLTITPVKTIDEVLKIALIAVPKPLPSVKKHHHAKKSASKSTK